MTSKLKTIFKFLLAFVMMYLLYHYALLNLNLLRDLIYQPLTLVILVGLLLINIFLSAWRWYRLNGHYHLNLSFAATTIAIYVGLAFNNLLPGSIMGDISRMRFIYRYRHDDKLFATFSVIIDRMIGLLGVVATLFIFLNIKHISGSNIAYLNYFNYLSTIWTVVTIAILIAFAVYKHQIIHYPWFKFPFLQKILNANWSRLFTSMLIWECILASILTQLVIGMMIACIGYTLQFENFSLTDFMIASMITQLVNIIPIVPGGIGLGEMAFANTLILLQPGTNPGVATIYLIYRIFNALAVAPAIGFILTNKKPTINTNTIAFKDKGIIDEVY